MTRSVPITGMILLTGNVSLIIIVIITMSSPSHSSRFHEDYRYDGIVHGARISDLTPAAYLAMTGARGCWSHHRQRTLLSGSFYQMRSTILTHIAHLLKGGHRAFSSGGSHVAVLTGKLAAETVHNQ
jgi:hypothetical protein